MSRMELVALNHVPWTQLSSESVLLQVVSMTIHVPLRSPYFLLLLVALCLIRFVGKRMSFLSLSRPLDLWTS